jgi:RimJ/RimL family protein N-acetyltransferase
MPEFSLKTERLSIVPFSNSYLNPYYEEFTSEITKYQYPDSFSDIEAAKNVLSEFVSNMRRGNMLEMVLLTQDGEFLGSIEVFGLKEETPEVGLWLKKSVQGAGFGYEALRKMIEYLNSTKKYQYYIYEADIRNIPSIRLAEKFRFEKGGYEEITTESGKALKLQCYRIFC